MAPKKPQTRNRTATVDNTNSANVQKDSTSSANTAISKKKSENEQLSKQVAELTKQNTELLKSQQFLSNCFDVIKNELEKCKNDNNKHNGEISALTKKCSELSAEIKELKSKQNVGEQKSLNNNVLIRGVSGDENAYVVASNIAELVECDLQKEDILAARQIQSKDNNKSPCVLMQFADEKKKRDFVKRSKTKKINTQMYGYTGECKPIYVDEQLTRESFLLFKRAEALKKHGVNFVWIQSGNILMRETPKTGVIHIKSIEQLNEIEQFFITKEGQTNKDGKEIREVQNGKSVNNDIGQTSASTNTNAKDNGRGDTNRGRYVKQPAITISDDEYHDT